MLVGYIRVSTSSQKYDRQLDQLLKTGVDHRNIYEEKESGTKRDREQLNKMLSELKAGDTVVVADMTRISRSSKDLLDIVDKIKEKGAFIKSIKDTWLDTTSDNPYQSFLMTVMSGLSQLERDLISSRVKEGLEAARKRGHYPGRPKSRCRQENERCRDADLRYRYCNRTVPQHRQQDSRETEVREQAILTPPFGTVVPFG